MPAGGAITVAETGFGTGLNFICAWRLFKQHAPSGATLRYFSLDKFPLSTDDLKKALSVWPQIVDEAAELAAGYAKLGAGGGEVFLDDGDCIKLTLIFADVLEALETFAAKGVKADAWFFDGFDPAKNPDMWSEEVFRKAAAASSRGATCATFTVAGHVRRAMDAAGFSVQKSEGFGRKRQMLKGSLAR